MVTLSQLNNITYMALSPCTYNSPYCKRRSQKITSLAHHIGAALAALHSMRASKGASVHIRGKIWRSRHVQAAASGTATVLSCRSSTKRMLLSQRAACAPRLPR